MLGKLPLAPFNQREVNILVKTSGITRRCSLVGAPDGAIDRLYSKMFGIATTKVGKITGDAPHSARETAAERRDGMP